MGNELIFHKNLNEVSIQTQNILTDFKKQQIITEKDVVALSNAKNFAIASFTDTPMYRPMVVKLASVLSDGQFPTADAKFWQCKAEAEVHFNEMIRNIYKLESLKVDLEEINYKIKSLDNLLQSGVVKTDVGDPELMKFDLKRLIIKKESIEFELKLMEKNIKYRIEEVSDWCTIAENISNQCKYDLKDKNKSMTETLFKKLEYEISRASDEDSKKKLTDQLNTLKRLLFEKAKSKI
jgi:hypothetical protein